MNQSRKVQLFREGVESQDPRIDQGNTRPTMIATGYLNVTDLTAAKVLKDYGVVDEDYKIIRSTYPVQDFDYCLIDGQKFIPKEKRRVGNRVTIRVKGV